MTIVVKMSKPTFDVLTTGNVNLAFSSELATHAIFNIVDSSIADGNSSITLTHNLGYIPKTWVYQQLNDGADYLARIPRTDASSAEQFDYYITSTTIVISRSGTSGIDDFNVIIFTKCPNP